MKDISVIILNYNASEYTKKCIESIINNTSGSLNYEIIIVDNNSSLIEYNKIKKYNESENIKIIRSKINLGFSGGNTLGFQFTDSKYLFFLNNDCELLNDNLLLLYNFMEANNEAGLCSGQMYCPDLKLMKSINYLPTLSLKLLGNSTLRLFKPDKYPSVKKEYQSLIQVESLAGASLFFILRTFLIIFTNCIEKFSEYRTCEITDFIELEL